jgi:hypothetical protein
MMGAHMATIRATLPRRSPKRNHRLIIFVQLKASLSSLLTFVGNVLVGIGGDANVYLGR